MVDQQGHECRLHATMALVNANRLNTDRSAHTYRLDSIGFLPKVSKPVKSMDGKSRSTSRRIVRVARRDSIASSM